MPCIFADRYQHFRGTSCLYLQGRRNNLQWKYICKDSSCHSQRTVFICCTVLVRHVSPVRSHRRGNKVPKKNCWVNHVIVHNLCIWLRFEHKCHRNCSATNFFFIFMLLHSFFKYVKILCLVACIPYRRSRAAEIIFSAKETGKLDHVCFT